MSEQKFKTENTIGMHNTSDRTVFNEVDSIKEDDSHDEWQDTESEGEIQIDDYPGCALCGTDVRYGGKFCSMSCESEMFL